ncbi:MAG: DUF4340 domain-containing protein [Treponema sp.]|jgi:hypothetical protein|nr:DUF4340 domain-containing protein [Treponema sp.]
MADKYNNKIIGLLVLCGALLLVYILTFVFDPEKSAARGAAWTALDPKSKEDVRQIELDGEEQIILVKNNGLWFVSFEDALYPARQNKALELLDTLTARGIYAVRSKSEAAQEKLMLTETEARRIIVKDEAGITLLNLLIGAPDATMKEVYIRLADSKEIRSGEDVFSRFTSKRQNWYDLRLFPDQDKDALNVSSVQRVIVQMPPPEIFDESENVDIFTGSYTLSRENGGWILQDSGKMANTQTVETYIRRILDCEAAGFTSAMGANDPEFMDPSFPAGKLILELGNGSRKTITVGPKIDEKYSVAVSGSKYVYLLPSILILNNIFIDQETLTGE